MTIKTFIANHWAFFNKVFGEALKSEENKIKPPETKAIAGEGKTMSPETVAMAMLKGIQKGTYHIVPGAMSKFTYFMYRHAPGVVRWVIDAELKKYRRKNPTAG